MGRRRCDDLTLTEGADDVGPVGDDPGADTRDDRRAVGGPGVIDERVQIAVLDVGQDLSPQPRLRAAVRHAGRCKGQAVLGEDVEVRTKAVGDPLEQ